MEGLIHFSLLFDKLTQNEQTIFFTKMVQSVGMNFIKKAIFGYFAEKLLQFKPYDHTKITTTNNILSNIINARDSIEKNTSNKVLLDELPLPLISHIASFSKQTDYENLAKANRRIYIGCHSPYTLHQQTRMNQRIQPYKFQSVTSLTTSMKYFNKNIKTYCDISCFPNLNTLKLCSITQEIFFKTFNNEPKCINLDNIIHLQIDDDCYEDDLDQSHDNSQCYYITPINPQYVTLFLSQFTNLERFDQTGRIFDIKDRILNNAQNMAYLPKLSAICIQGVTYDNHYPQNDCYLAALIDKHAKQLQALSILEDDSWGENKVGKHLTENFTKLRELNIECEFNDSLIANCNLLEMVSIRVANTRVCKVVETLIKTNQNVKLLEINAPRSSSGYYWFELGVDNGLTSDCQPGMIEEIKKGLNGLKNCEKQLFYLRLSMPNMGYCCDGVVTDDDGNEVILKLFVKELKKLIHVLQSCKTKCWIFECVLPDYWFWSKCDDSGNILIDERFNEFKKTINELCDNNCYLFAEYWRNRYCCSVSFIVSNDINARKYKSDVKKTVIYINLKNE
eukprot:277238_1